MWRCTLHLHAHVKHSQQKSFEALNYLALQVPWCTIEIPCTWTSFGLPLHNSTAATRKKIRVAHFCTNFELVHGSSPRANTSQAKWWTVPFLAHYPKHLWRLCCSCCPGSHRSKCEWNLSSLSSPPHQSASIRHEGTWTPCGTVHGHKQISMLIYFHAISCNSMCFVLFLRRATQNTMKPYLRSKYQRKDSSSDQSQEYQQHDHKILKRSEEPCQGVLKHSNRFCGDVLISTLEKKNGQKREKKHWVVADKTFTNV